jgi:hypothetical protein
MQSMQTLIGLAFYVLLIGLCPTMAYFSFIFHCISYTYFIKVYKAKHLIPCWGVIGVFQLVIHRIVNMPKTSMGLVNLCCVQR